MDGIPSDLFHYYNRSDGPFRSISRLPPADAAALQARLRDDPARFAASRAEDYLLKRTEIENRVRALFIGKGGKPRIEKPHYFILGECPWLLEWYPRGEFIRLPLALVPPAEVSFTYGDTFPAFFFEDGKPYRKRVFTCAELPELIRLYGLPQKRNPDGQHGPDRYIEAQLWSDGPIARYLPRHEQ